MFLKFIVIYASVHLGLADVSNFYWRDYKGVIPTDALVGAVDRDGNKLYIAHEYKNNLGIIPHGLYGVPSSIGRKLIFKVMPQIHIFGVQVLCVANSKRFAWKQIMEPENFLKETAQVDLVEGGLENNRLLYICKTMYKNQPYIGKVLNRNNEDGTCLFFYKEDEYIAESYDTLIITSDNYQ